MSRRYKRAVGDRDVDRYFPVRISIVIGMGLPAREWGITFSARLDWLRETAGHGRHAVLPGTVRGQPDAMRVLLREHLAVDIAAGRGPSGFG
jgi:hypothetical protein